MKRCNIPIGNWIVYLKWLITRDMSIYGTPRFTLEGPSESDFDMQNVVVSVPTHRRYKNRWSPRELYLRVERPYLLVPTKRLACALITGALDHRESRFSKGVVGLAENVRFPGEDMAPPRVIIWPASIYVNALDKSPTQFVYIQPLTIKPKRDIQ